MRNRLEFPEFPGNLRRRGEGSAKTGALSTGVTPDSRARNSAQDLPRNPTGNGETDARGGRTLRIDGRRPNAGLFGSLFSRGPACRPSGHLSPLSRCRARVVRTMNKPHAVTGPSQLLWVGVTRPVRHRLVASAACRHGCRGDRLRRARGLCRPLHPGGGRDERVAFEAPARARLLRFRT